MSVDKYKGTNFAVMEFIDDVCMNVPGWTPPDQLLALYIFALSTAPLRGDIIEIGSWCGRSTCVLARAARDSGVGLVHAIDLFPTEADWRQNADGTHSFSVEIDGVRISAYDEQTVWDEPYQRDIAPLYKQSNGIYAMFEASLNRYQLREFVRPFKGTISLFAAAQTTPIMARFAFIDGDHSYRGVREDIVQVEKLLAPGGWISFDDAFSHYEGVDRAITEMVVESGRYQPYSQLCRKFFAARRTE